jgi:hypothetical protein
MADPAPDSPPPANGGPTADNRARYEISLRFGRNAGATAKGKLL